MFSMPALYFLCKAPSGKQMLRACLVVISLAFYIGIKDVPTLAMCPMLSLVFFCSADLTPFSTAIALMINLTVKHET